MNARFPAQWTAQVTLEQSFVEKSEPEHGLAFRSMLPNSVGYISQDGRTVMYGEEYRKLKAEGKIP